MMEVLAEHMAQILAQLQQLTTEAEELRRKNAVMHGAGANLENELAAARPELEAARAAKAAAVREHEELRNLGVPQLRTRLEACFAERQTALQRGFWGDAETLADTEKKLTAALRAASEAEALAASDWKGA